MPKMAYKINLLKMFGFTILRDMELGELKFCGIWYVCHRWTYMIHKQEILDLGQEFLFGKNVHTPF